MEELLNKYPALYFLIWLIIAPLGLWLRDKTYKTTRGYNNLYEKDMKLAEKQRRKELKAIRRKYKYLDKPKPPSWKQALSRISKALAKLIKRES